MKATVRLRDVEASDLALFFEHQRDPVAVEMVMFRSRDKAEFAQRWAKLLADNSCLKKTIVFDGQVVGNVGSWTSDGKRKIGYWLDRAFWGRGIATEAISAFLGLEPTRPLYAGVAKHNAASIRVLQKCGFKFLQSDDGGPDSAGDTQVSLMLAASATR